MHLWHDPLSSKDLLEGLRGVPGWGLPLPWRFVGRSKRWRCLKSARSDYRTEQTSTPSKPERISNVDHRLDHFRPHCRIYRE
jgi:hypothetical protein